jgi:hypothetical protein
MSGDIIYIIVDKTIHIYTLANPISLITTYPLNYFCNSGIITDNHLYIGGLEKLIVLEQQRSMRKPLSLVAKFKIK